MTVAQGIVVAIGAIAVLIGLFGGRVLVDTYMLDRAGKVRRWLGLVLVVVGAYLGLGAFFEPPTPDVGEGLPWATEAEIEQSLVRAREEGKPVLIDFWTESCTNCKVLERETLLHPDVREILVSEFVLLKLNTNTLYDNDRARYDDLREKYGNIDSQPYIVFLNAEGEFLTDLSFHGLKDAAEVLELLPKVRDAQASAEDGGLADDIESQGILWVLLVVFVGGIGASLTPCVYPLIPITLSVFGARESSSRLQSFGLSCIYVSGIVLTYTVLGLVAAFVGKGIGEAMSNPYVLVGIAAVMVAMGLSSLGLYELNLPTSLQTKLSSKGGKGALGAFVMGLLAGVVATPCVGPILVTILVFVAQSQDMLLGGLLLATFALGMGMLFLVLGTFAGLLSRIPRGGPWMVGVKTFFGVVFLVLALYYLRLAFPVVKAPIHALYGVADLL